MEIGGSLCEKSEKHNGRNEIHGLQQQHESPSMLHNLPKQFVLNWNSISWNCQQCNKSFCDYKIFSNHQLSRHDLDDLDNIDYHCSECNEVVVGYAKFLNHIRNTHFDELGLCCDVCNESLPDYEQLALHRDKHTELFGNVYPSVYHCSLCADVFPSERDLKSHTQKTHDLRSFGNFGEANLMISNEDAEESLDNLASFQDNNFFKSLELDLGQVECNETKSKSVFQCGTCMSKFISEGTLQNHMSKHAESRPHTCGVCFKGFRTSTALGVHTRTHTGERPYVCEICKERFQHSHILKIHMHKHSGERPYSCNICSKSFQYPHALTIHIRNHADKRPYSCDICFKRFNYAHVLTRHQNIVHSREKNYKCEVCEKNFATRSNLKNHMIIHTEERPFVCEICDKSFQRQQILLNHQLLHTGECPYKCTLCSKGFTRKSLLRVHMAMHTGKGDFHCKLCPKSFISQDDFDLSDFSNPHIQGPIISRFSSILIISCTCVIAHLFAGFILPNYRRLHKNFKRLLSSQDRNEFVLEAFWVLDPPHDANSLKSNGIGLFATFFPTVLRLFSLKHFRCHIEERPFQCELCDKRFTNKSSWKRHDKTCPRSLAVKKMSVEKQNSE